MQTTIAEFTLLRDCVDAGRAGTVGSLLESPILTHAATLRRRRAPVEAPITDDRTVDEATVVLGVERGELIPAAASNEAQRIQGVAEALDRRNRATEPLVLVPEALVDQAVANVCAALFAVSDHLAAAGDAIDAAGLTRLLASLKIDERFDARVGEALPAIGDAIVLLLLRQPVDHGYLADATRIWWVGRLILDVAGGRKGLSARDVRALLARKLFIALDLSTAFPHADVRLIRAATVSDLYVVRNEWRGYAKGEVAALKNIMAGERLKKSDKQTRESESTQLTESQQSTQQEQSQETRTSSELSREVTSQLTASLQARVGGEVTGAFPGGTYRVGANAEGSIGIAVAERLAARTAQEAVNRAVSRTDTTVRTQRTSRELARFEDAAEYELSNTDETNRRGVYRWLDRVERFQVFKIPDRLQLEFQLPNPAEFYKHRLAHAALAAGTGGPPDWTVTLDLAPLDKTLDTIATQSQADVLATRYRAGDVPALPKEFISLAETKTLEAKNVPPDNKETQVVSPVAAGELDMVIPDGYEAIEVRYFMSGSPARARWARERGNNDNSKAGWDNADPHVFHSIVLESFVGGQSHYKNDWLGEDQGIDDLLTTQGNNWNVSTGFGSAYARSSGTQVVKFVDADAAPPFDNPVRVKLKLGFKGVGAAHMQVGVQVICRRTAERYASWRQQVFETLFTAWSRWDRDFRSAQESATIFGTSASTERSSSKNREAIREELKRQVIAWLLEEVPFGGRPAMKPAKVTDAVPWREFDVDQIFADAPIVQFFEQALDWSNLGWIFYPYYWAGKDDWLELAAHQAADPEYERFLRSGAVRVLVPVRPSFEDAVHYWLVYRKPFLGRGLPLPSDRLYVSVATEIRNLTEAAVDGEPVDRAWDAKTSTVFTWLEDDLAVPANDDAMLGKTETTLPLHPIAIE